MVSWQKEYLRILEQLESAKEPRVMFHYPGNERIGTLLKELADENFIDGTFCIGPQAEAAITYKGRLELDRLRSLRPLNKVLSYAGSALVFAAGVVVTKMTDWLFGLTSPCP